MNATANPELGCKVEFTEKGWERATPELIGKARHMMHQSLRSQGCKQVTQYAPFHAMYRDDEGTWHSHWELAAYGVSLCIRDGHMPHENPLAPFMCGRCNAITDRDAYDAFVAVHV